MNVFQNVIKLNLLIFFIDFKLNYVKLIVEFNLKLTSKTIIHFLKFYYFNIWYNLMLKKWNWIEFEIDEFSFVIFDRKSRSRFRAFDRSGGSGALDISGLSRGPIVVVRMFACPPSQEPQQGMDLGRLRWQHWIRIQVNHRFSFFQPQSSPVVSVTASHQSVPGSNPIASNIFHYFFVPFLSNK